MIIAIDFDGTITEKNEFPKIGKAREHVFEAIKNFQKHGHVCILWTCRHGKTLIDAIEFLRDNGVEMNAYNDNVYDLDTRKIVADVYIDDKNIFMDDNVDWYKIENYILSYNILSNYNSRK